MNQMQTIIEARLKDLDVEIKLLDDCFKKYGRGRKTLEITIETYRTNKELLNQILVANNNNGGFSSGGATDARFLSNGAL